MNNIKKIAVASRSFSNHPVLKKELLEKYPHTKFNDAGKTLSGAELIDFLKGHERAIIALERLDEKIFSALPELKVISKYGVGLDMIDLDAMERHNVLLGWEGGVNRRSVAELALSFMISLLHRVPYAINEIERGKWYQVKGQQLTGKIVGIIGCGNIGKDLVRLLEPFECKIIVYDIQEYTEFYKKYNIITMNLEELIRE
ncbi:MAG: hypothetical protein N2596_06025, partial [Syntrophorhabdaceae bacterium]|nr:hypothetical protein [Syntrophorhabdaceae bacterium]